MNLQPIDAAIAFSARILGALFYYSPDDRSVAPMVAAFRDGSWVEQWPEAVSYRPELIDLFKASCDESLPEAWQRLFIGPYALPASPWGSVWLDKENVLFGDSTLALRQWMRDNDIVFEAVQNEPEDHFGLMLMLSAWLKETGQEDKWQELLAWHFLTWCDRFLEVYIEKAGHPFYLALGHLAQQSIAMWKTRLRCPVADKKLYC